jgi:hypothetical protein
MWSVGRVVRDTLLSFQQWVRCMIVAPIEERIGS